MIREALDAGEQALKESSLWRELSERQVVLLVLLAMCRAFGGQRVYWPTKITSERDKAIRQHYAAGVNIQQLSARYQLSTRQIREVIGKRGSD